MSPVKRTIITLATAFCVGIGASYLWYDTTELDTTEELSQERVTKPEKGVQTAPFALRLLQAAMEVQQEGNIVVAPDSLAALLNRLKDFSAGPAQKALEALKLPSEPTQTAVLPSELALLFPDTSVRLQPDVVTGRDIYPTPFSQNLSAAYIAMDNAMGFYSEQDLNGTTLSSLISPSHSQEGAGTAVNSDIRLVALNGISFHEPWMIPPTSAGADVTDFTNADGSTSAVTMVKHQGLYREAKAPDGSWQAAAIFFSNDSKAGDSACVVVILPKEDSAREFAKNLTPEKLAEIRSALLDVPKAYGTIELPGIAYAPTSQDLRPVLSELGLGCLFTEEKPFPKLTSSVAPLTMAIQQYRLNLTENPESTEGEQQEHAPAKAQTLLKADRPFFWYIGDLASDQLPYLMGIVEKL